MGKQETLGFVLIGLVLILWMWLSAPPPRQTPPAAPPETQQPERPPEKTVPADTVPAKPRSSGDSLGTFFSHLATGTEKVLVIKTDLYTAEVTTRGGRLKKWELTRYKTWDGYPVQMVDPDYGGDFGLLFISSDGKEIRTSTLYFTADYSPWKTVELKERESYTVNLVLPVSDTRQIVKKLTFHNGSYGCEAEVELRNMERVIANYEYQITWDSGVRYAEYNSVDESGYAQAYAYSGGELIDVNADETDHVTHRDINGAVDWVAARNKYFGVALLPEEGSCQGAIIEGVKKLFPDKGQSEHYSLGLKMPYKGNQVEGAHIDLFLGPLDYDVISAYGKDLQHMMSLGAAWIIRPIAEYIMIPLFNLIHFFIPNYGFVIIVFSIIIKVVLHPLSKTSMKSMKRMQALQPMMNEIKEKYKEDPQKMNAEVMKLYKDYGVNPAAGCLPMLLQMPILFALYAVFRSSIELRQAGFIGWIHDLSIPDVAFRLPFSIPLFGISDVSGLALAMGITMFIQQKMTVTDPRQKAMVYMMPIMMTLIFNNLPSGLNLYYFVFNLLSIGQQMLINKNQPNEPLRKVERKKRSGGLMERLAKDLPKPRR